MYIQCVLADRFRLDELRLTIGMPSFIMFTQNNSSAYVFFFLVCLFSLHFSSNFLHKVRKSRSLRTTYKFNNICLPSSISTHVMVLCNFVWSIFSLLTLFWPVFQLVLSTDFIILLLFGLNVELTRRKCRNF